MQETVHHAKFSIKRVKSWCVGSHLAVIRASHIQGSPGMGTSKSDSKFHHGFVTFVVKWEEILVCLPSNVEAAFKKAI